VLVSTTQFASGSSRIDALLEQVYGLGPISMEVVMAVSIVVEMSAFQVASRRIALIAASAVFFATVQAQAQQAQTAPEGRRRTAAIRYAHKLAGRLTRSVAESEGLTPNRSG
jgi:hypothetical protein